jgi:hypothetical protein
MPNKPRSTFNTKRALAIPIPPQEELSALAECVRYGGNPEHKRNPGDFGLTPPSAPRADKTLCDMAGIVSRPDALAALRAGVLKGLVSRRRRGEFPQNIWSVRGEGGEFVLEAQLENEASGTYHGYPMPEADPFREVVLGAWNSR